MYVTIYIYIYMSGLRAEGAAPKLQTRTSAAAKRPPPQIMILMIIITTTIVIVAIMIIKQSAHLSASRIENTQL